MPNLRNLFDSLIMQESGGRPGVPGQMTKWGRPMGLTQMLPATAQEMAKKAGLPWDERLLSDRTDRGYQYQKRLGQEYFKEGMERTGNVRDALHYYHGGPNRKMWGPKTRSYAEQILARVRQGQEMLPNPRRLPGQDPITAALSPNGLPDIPFASFQGPLNISQGMGPQTMRNAQQALNPAQQPDGPPNLAAMSGYSSINDPLAPKPKAFGKGGVGWMILGALGDALAGYGGQKGSFAPAMADLAAQDRQEKFAREKMNMEAQQRLAELQARAAEPIRHTNSAGDMVEIDPRTGQPRVIYADPYGKTQWQRVENPQTGGIDIVNNGSTPRPNENHLRHLLSTGDKENFDAKFGPGMADYYLQRYGGAR